MIAPTHAVFGLFLTLSIVAIFGIKEGLHWTLLLTAIFGSLLPDIDMPKSGVGRLFSVISIPLEQKYGHRMVTHSLIGWVIATVLWALILIPIFILFHLTLGHTLRLLLAFSVGYMSHIIIDMFNPRGVPLFWPDLTRDVIPGNPKFRPETGSKAEIGIFLFLIVLLSLALPISHYGPLTTLRWLLATPEAVIEEFKASNTRTFVQFQGTHQHSKTAISATAEIIDIHQKTLIIWHQNAIYTLSSDLNSDINATTFRAIHTTIPIRTTHKTFTHQTVQKLLSQLTDTDLVSGIVILPAGLTLDIPFTVREATPILQVKDRLTLTFATKAQLNALKFDDAFTKHQNSIKTKISLLTQTRKKLSAQLKTLDNTDSDLTDLGKQMLSKNHDGMLQKKEAIQAQLDSTNDTLETLKSEVSDQPFKFSGEVWIRSVTPLNPKEKI
jgi:membrane-bound metal-dependent hydrolase YbcI (DUF457 family)